MAIGCVSLYQLLLADERDAQLEDILGRWHVWQLVDRAEYGHNSSGTGFQDYRSSRQYDDENGALDAAIENSIMASVQGCVDAMPNDLRPACYMMARNAHVGASVFRGRPMNSTVSVANEIRDRARVELIKRLVSAGVIE